MTGIDAADVAAYLAAFARTAALAETAPLIGDQTMPRRIRAVVAAVLAIAGVSSRSGLDPAHLVSVLPLEIGIGLVAGICARIIMIGIDTGGQLIGVEWGIGFAGQVDPASGDDALPTRRILSCLAGLAFIATGGLEAIVHVITAPTPDTSGLLILAADIPVRMGQVLVETVRIAGPLMLAGFVVTLSTGLASRSAPAVNLFSVEFALRGLVAMAVLVACAPSLIAEVTGAARLAGEAMAVLGGPR